MGLKKFEATVEVIQHRDVAVYAESMEEAVVKARTLSFEDIDEGTLNDHEKRVIGVSRYKDSRMYS